MPDCMFWLAIGCGQEGQMVISMCAQSDSKKVIKIKEDKVDHSRKVESKVCLQ